MHIAIIGAGNIGGTLARNWAAKGHHIHLGVRNAEKPEVQALLQLTGITAHTVAEAAALAEVIVISATPPSLRDICDQLGDTRNKVIIDTMNSVRSKAGDFDSTFDALKVWTNGEIVKCYNCTGYENLANPHYEDTTIEMYMAGSSIRGKELTRQLTLDLGFAECIDVGGDAQVALLEQWALFWINLAFAQGMGRGFAFKLLKRNK